ncbi:MAG: Tol biopolymer transport system component [Candidatus Krumholzibacteriia bacterium]|jgi:Tol biopolymer transport system component
MIGKSLLHYDITAKLGEGGMGAVYLATDSKLGREVAIKILPDHFAKDPERLARFHREARTLAALNHPNIAGIHGLEADQGLNFLVMECAEGEDLSALIARGPVPCEEALTICRDIASGMEEAHQNGIIHRDLKPANVKISSDGRAKILDFGLARAFQGESTAEEETLNSPTITAAMTGAGVILGTAAYMSPEQARGMAVDRRSDIWSFGALVYELFTGIRLFRGDTISDTLAGILKTDPDWDALPDDTPDTVRVMLARCLNRDRQQRLQDIGEARILLSGDGISSLYSSLSLTSVGDLAEAPARRTSRAVMVGALVALLIGLGAGGFLAQSFRQKEAPKGARHFDVTTAEGVTAAAEFPGISPDGTRAFYVIDGALWLRRFDTGANVQVPGPSEVSQPFWSPDSRNIGYFSRSGMMRVSADGGQPQKICDATTRDVADGAEWLVSDQILFSSGKHNGIQSVAAGGGAPTVIIVPDTLIVQDVHEVVGIDDDQSFLYVAHLNGGTYTHIYHYQNGQQTLVVDTDTDRILEISWSNSGQILYEIDGPNNGIWAVKFDPKTSQTLGEPYLVAGGYGWPSISDEEDLLCAPGDNKVEWQLVKCSRDGEVLRTYGEPDTYGLFFELSPDGQQIMSTIRSGPTESPLWLIDLNRGTQRRITFKDYNYSSGSWAPDGEYYYGAGSIGNSPSSYVIQKVSVEGTADPVSVSRGNTCSISPDGETIIYSLSHKAPFSWSLGWSNIEKASETESQSLEDFAPDQIFELPAWQYGPEFSPDGKYVAYISRENGVDEIFLRRFPEGDLKRLVSLDGGGWPQWNGVGDRLYYISGSDIMEVEIAISPRLQIGTPQKLFTRQPDVDKVFYQDWPMPFQVSDDGESFYMFYQSTPKTTKKALTFIQNWHGE